LRQRSRAAREALDNAIMSGNTANLQALSIEVGNAETELTFAQAQVQAEVYNILTADQKQRIAERRKEMQARRAEMLKRRQGQTQ
jgi:Spy/CpxP family protein refolding chaperone